MTDNPYLTAEIERLVSRYGSATVREHVTLICKGKAGRKAERDWPLLMNEVDQDARDWLAGNNPAQIRTDYSIAQAFSQRHPGQSSVSTHRRIMRKLREGRERAFHVQALWICERERPFSEFFNVAAKTAKFAPSVLRLADLYLGKLERYRRAHGQPREAMTIIEIGEEVDRLPTNYLAEVLGRHADKIDAD